MPVHAAMQTVRPSEALTPGTVIFASAKLQRRDAEGHFDTVIRRDVPLAFHIPIDAEIIAALDGSEITAQCVLLTGATGFNEMVGPELAELLGAANGITVTLTWTRIGGLRMDDPDSDYSVLLSSVAAVHDRPQAAVTRVPA
jgi:hypothetical protein